MTNMEIQAGLLVPLNGKALRNAWPFTTLTFCCLIHGSLRFDILKLDDCPRLFLGMIFDASGTEGA